MTKKFKAMCVSADKRLASGVVLSDGAYKSLTANQQVIVTANFDHRPIGRTTKVELEKTGLYVEFELDEAHENMDILDESYLFPVVIFDKSVSGELKDDPLVVLDAKLVQCSIFSYPVKTSLTKLERLDGSNDES